MYTWDTVQGRQRSAKIAQAPTVRGTYRTNSEGSATPLHAQNSQNRRACGSFHTPYGVIASTVACLSEVKQYFQTQSLSRTRGLKNARVFPPRAESSLILPRTYGPRPTPRDRPFTRSGRCSASPSWALWPRPPRAQAARHRSAPSRARRGSLQPAPRGTV